VAVAFMPAPEPNAVAEPYGVRPRPSALKLQGRDRGNSCRSAGGGLRASASPVARLRPPRVWPHRQGHGDPLPGQDVLGRRPFTTVARGRYGRPGHLAVWQHRLLTGIIPLTGASTPPSPEGAPAPFGINAGIVHANGFAVALFGAAGGL